MNRICLFGAMLGLLFITACSEDTPDPTSDPIPGEEISGIWAVAEPEDAIGPENEPADGFSNFSINISATSSRVSYVTTNSGDALVFPEQGTFAVEESDNFESGADVVRGPDNVDTRITLTENGDVMTMSFTIDVSMDAVNGRIASINGDYTFILQKQ